jgi:hypothetical protein
MSESFAESEGQQFLASLAEGVAEQLPEPSDAEFIPGSPEEGPPVSLDPSQPVTDAAVTQLDAEA